MYYLSFSNKAKELNPERNTAFWMRTLFENKLWLAVEHVRWVHVWTLLAEKSASWLWFAKMHLLYLLTFSLWLEIKLSFLLRANADKFLFSSILVHLGPWNTRLVSWFLKYIVYSLCDCHRNAVLSRSRKCKLSLNFDNRRKFWTDSLCSFYHPTQSVKWLCQQVS